MINNVSYVFLWILALFNALVGFVLMHKLAEIRRIMNEGPLGPGGRLPAGSRFPAFQGVTVPDGQPISAATIARRSKAILFVAPSCADCREITSGIAATTVPVLDNLAIYCDGSLRSCNLFVPESLKQRCLVFTRDEDDVVSLFLLPGFPVLVTLDNASRILSYHYPTRAQAVVDLLVKSESSTAKPAFDGA
jgi:hypothetical protein